MSEAEEVAKRIETINNTTWPTLTDHQRAAALIRSQAARISELERRQIKVRWKEHEAFVGPHRVGMICQIDSVRDNWVAVYHGSFLSHNELSESEARAAVEAEAVKMMEGE